ncbi:MAG: hypothetical protein AB8G95_26495 [Anaerolineae bacterium]
MQRKIIVIGSGLLLGLIIGFYLGWVVLPVELVDVTPADLETEFQDDYLRLIASTYAAEQNIDQASSRIGSLGRADWPDWLLQETIDQILIDPAGSETVHMVNLSRAMGIDSPAFDQVVSPVSLDEPTLLPTPTQVSQ